MSEKYNITRVYLATDDQAVIQESATYNNEFEFVHLNFDRTIMDNTQLIER